LSAKHKIGIGLMVSVVFLGLWKIADKPTSKQGRTSNMADQAARERDVVSAAIKRPAKEVLSKTPDEDIEEFIAFLDELGKAGDSSEEGDFQKMLAVSNETPLSYEEELRQRFNRIKETPEYKAVNSRLNELNWEHTKIVKNPEYQDWRRRYAEYVLNRYSVFGLTLDEGRQKRRGHEFSAEELEYMSEVGQNLERERTAWEEKFRAAARDRHEWHQKRLELMDMTDEEFRIAIAEYRRVLQKE